MRAHVAGLCFALLLFVRLHVRESGVVKSLILPGFSCLDKTNETVSDHSKAPILNNNRNLVLPVSLLHCKINKSLIKQHYLFNINH